MTEIVYTCDCGQIYRFDSRFAGRPSRCIHCKREYRVPEQVEQIESTDDLEQQILDLVSVAGRTEKRVKKILLGRYEIREQLGVGGMGYVFSAWDTRLRREVSLKILNRKSRQRQRDRERFINEARITGKLAHSGVIPVYSLDFDSKDNPYYVMRLLEGRTLKQLIEDYHHSKVLPFSPERLRELLRHFIDACHAIAYAHDNHVVHRDIKPSNIMSSGYGETLVLDWGLAKSFSTVPGSDESEADGPDETDEDAPHLTMTGSRVGTLGYQSPEYLRNGISHPSDDIYALGVTLYVMICDRMPHEIPRDRRGFFEIMMTSPRHPHLINPHADRSLSAVCLCALAFDTEKRYPSAALLAADLQRWLDGEAVSVYRMGTREKITLTARKNVAWIALALAAFLAGALFARLLF